MKSANAAEGSESWVSSCQGKGGGASIDGTVGDYRAQLTVHKKHLTTLAAEVGQGRQWGRQQGSQREPKLRGRGN